MGSDGLGFSNCKACGDFKSWAKAQSVKHEGKVENPNLLLNKECPLDSEALGNMTWSYLHTLAAYYPPKATINQQKDMKSFLDLFAKFYPCKVCATDFQKDMKELPPQTESAEALSNWLCKIHNRVNVKLGKPEFDCSKVFERWKDGWNDGSCD